MQQLENVFPGHGKFFMMFRDDFYRPHSEGMGKVLFSQVSVYILGGGGCPHLADRGGTSIQLMVSGGIPIWPMGLPHGTSKWDWMGVIPPHPIGTGMGSPPSPPSGDRAAEGALAMRRSVCLLRSRRRTFLFVKYEHNMWYWWMKYSPKIKTFRGNWKLI